jgi:predicted metal-binding protein
MGNEHRQKIENFIAEFPVCEYIFLEKDDLVFSDKVRFICQNECERYGHSWACPPVIGTIEECMERCSHFQHVLLFSTAADVPDIADFQGCLNARRDHEQVSYELTQRMRQEFGETLTLTTGCMTCDTCAYPDEPCRHPEQRFATIESHGILIMQTAADAGLSYNFDGHTVIYFSLILYND